MKQFKSIRDAKRLVDAVHDNERNRGIVAGASYKRPQSTQSVWVIATGSPTDDLYDGTFQVWDADTSAFIDADPVEDCKVRSSEVGGTVTTDVPLLGRIVDSVDDVPIVAVADVGGLPEVSTATPGSLSGFALTKAGVGVGFPRTSGEFLFLAQGGLAMPPGSPHCYIWVGIGVWDQCTVDPPAGTILYNPQQVMLDANTLDIVIPLSFNAVIDFGVPFVRQAAICYSVVAGAGSVGQTQMSIIPIQGVPALGCMEGSGSGSTSVSPLPPPPPPPPPSPPAACCSVIGTSATLHVEGGPAAGDYTIHFVNDGLGEPVALFNVAGVPDGYVFCGASSGNNWQIIGATVEYATSASCGPPLSLTFPATAIPDATLITVTGI